MKGSQMDRVLQKLRDNALNFTPDIAVSSYKGLSVKLPLPAGHQLDAPEQHVEPFEYAGRAGAGWV